MQIVLSLNDTYVGVGKLKVVWRAALAHGVGNWLDQRHAVTLGSPVVGVAWPCTDVNMAQGSLGAALR